MKTQAIFLRVLLFSLFTTSAPALAQVEGTYQVIVKKQEEKKQTRWTLAEWLALKERNRQMDMWLARNSQTSPFEFYLDLGSRSEGLSLDALPGQVTNRQSLGANFAAYATIAGLRGGYESEASSGGVARTLSSGSFNLRVFGKAVQDTNLNLEYGIRGLRLKPSGGTEENFQNQFGGGTFTLYLTKYFGVDASYHKILKSEANSAGRTVEGDQTQASLFIDFSFVRVFGSWQKEALKFGSQSGSAAETREGYGGGLRFFF